MQNSDQPGRPINPYMPNFGPEDYAPPEWRLVQAPSRAHTESDIPLGHFYCDQTGETTPSLDLIILKVLRNRTYWINDDLTFPNCSSDDRVMPRPGGMYQGPCNTCEANGRGCKPGYNLLCVKLDNQRHPDPAEMFLLRVNNTSVFPFLKLWSRIKLNHQDIPWSIAITLTSEKKTNDKGTYWVMQPNINQEVTYQLDLTLTKSLADEVAGFQEQGQIDQETKAIQQHTAAPTIAAAPDSKATNRLVPISKQEAQDTVALANKLSVPPNTITTFINNTFGKDRILQLHTGELGMLNKWLEQNFGQTQESPEEEDTLPF